MSSQETFAPDTVYLYQFARWQFGPNQSMPCFRVEAFLRLHNIPHFIIPSSQSGPLGRWPWARYNGAVLADSQLIIDHIAEARGIVDDITEEQKGVALAVERMLDFHVYPFVVRWSWVDNMDFVRRYSSFKVPGPQFLTTMLQNYVRKGLIKYLNAGGWGEYPDDEYRRQWVADIRAIAQILGDKPFLFGDRPTRTDASVFAFLQAITVMPREAVLDGIAALVAEDGAPLRPYLARIEALLFPDMETIKAHAGSTDKEKFPKEVQ